MLEAMLLRRLLLLAVALLLLATIAAGLAPREDDRVTASASGAAALPAGRTVVKRISAAPGADATVVVRSGDLLRLEVAGDTLDTVLLERLDRLDAVEPSTPARFELLIDQTPGVYPIRLLDAGRRIGRIEIRRRG